MMKLVQKELSSASRLTIVEITSRVTNLRRNCRSDNGDVGILSTYRIIECRESVGTVRVLSVAQVILISDPKHDTVSQPASEGLGVVGQSQVSERLVLRGKDVKVTKQSNQLGMKEYALVTKTKLLTRHILLPNLPRGILAILEEHQTLCLGLP